MSESIVLRVKRPMLFRGRRVEAGETLKAEPPTADELLSSGRAELVHAPDGEAVRQARRDSIKRAIKAAGRPWDGPNVSAPWQRVQ